MASKPWTPAEDAILRNIWKNSPSGRQKRAQESLPERSISAIDTRVSKLDLRVSGRHGGKRGDPKLEPEPTPPFAASHPGWERRSSVPARGRIPDFLGDLFSGWGIR